MSKKKIINAIIEVEGGYVDDPSDSGGETNFGITKKVARENGFMGEMIDLPKEKAFEIYLNDYWHSVRGDDLELISEKLADEVADTAVNMGVKRSGEFLQRALNALNNRGVYFDDLTIDGAIGRKTIDALGLYFSVRKEAGIAVLIKTLNCLQGAAYVDLVERREKDERFFFGWIRNRVEI